MNRRELLSAIRRGFAVTLFVGAVGCTDKQIATVEDGLWELFAGHPKPIILNKPAPPVYCYETIGEPQCFSEPLEGQDRRLIKY